MGGGFGSDEPCEGWGSVAVFVGRVASVSVIPKRGEWDMQHRVYLFEILEAFVGVQGKTVEVSTGMGGGDCGLDFEIGETYFVYTGGDANGNLWVGACSDRTKKLAQAEADLAFAREAQRGEWTALYGRVRTNVRENLSDQAAGLGMTGVTVTVEGPRGQRFEAVTDDFGKFTVKGQLEGTYTVRAKVPPGYPAAAPQKVEVLKGECEGAEILVTSLGTIQGRVVDAQRKPVNEMKVALMPVDSPYDEYEIALAYTDTEGNYLFEEVPPGVYFLAANPDGPGAYGQAYQPAYYPQASDLDSATRVTLEPSAALELRDIRLSPADRPE